MVEGNHPLSFLEENQCLRFLTWCALRRSKLQFDEDDGPEGFLGVRIETERHQDHVERNLVRTQQGCSRIFDNTLQGGFCWLCC